MLEGPHGPPPSLLGRKTTTPEGLKALAERVASGTYAPEPKIVAEALLRHLDFESFWTLVASGDIQRILGRPRR